MGARRVRRSKELEFKVSLEAIRGEKQLTQIAENVVVERFWRSLKHEEVYLKDCTDLPEARREIGRYIERYKAFRPHQALGGRIPDAAYVEGRG